MSNSNSEWSRRSFLSAVAVTSGGALVTEEQAFGRKSNRSVNGRPVVRIKSGLGSTGDIWAEVGVTPIVNINGTLTVIGGSVIPAEAMELYRQGNEHCCNINDLEVAAGRWMAKLCKWPAGYTGLVTCGAAAGILVAYAGMMTEDLTPRIRQCPDVAGFPKTEVVIQKAHRYPFDHQIRQTGARLVEVETKEEMINAINPKTLAIHFLHINADRGKVSGQETLEIAKAHGLYTFDDAAADVPPIERLWTMPQEGWDFVAFSGGKDIKGPQATGLLIGKEQLIHYALLNMSPNEDTIGRPCKVGKEAIFAFLKALEIFVNRNSNQTIANYDNDAGMITKAIKKFGVTELPRRYNPDGLGNVTPHYSWRIDPSRVKITGHEVMEQLAATRPLAIGTMQANSGGESGHWPAGNTERNDQEGNLEWNPQSQSITPAPTAWLNGEQPPSDERRFRRNRDPHVFGFAMWQLKDGEAKIVRDRLVEIFSQAPKV
ncbi:MAG TPA: aminotransferase class V-fold PLP-dependent enzyme [Terriglobia bacterium]|nr:aminotransferase class V-fold PLP-dependent enzyme [Terriglobia bacterium]